MECYKLNINELEILLVSKLKRPIERNPQLFLGLSGWLISIILSEYLVK